MAHVPARIDRIRARMEEQSLDVLYVRGVSNIAWLTGFERVFDAESAHAVVIAPGICDLHTDSRYFTALRRPRRIPASPVDMTRCPHSAFLVSRLAPLMVFAAFASEWRIRLNCGNTAPLNAHAPVRGRACRVRRFIEALSRSEGRPEVAAMRGPAHHRRRSSASCPSCARG